MQYTFVIAALSPRGSHAPLSMCICPVTASSPDEIATSGQSCTTACLRIPDCTDINTCSAQPPFCAHAFKAVLGHQDALSPSYLPNQLHLEYENGMRLATSIRPNLGRACVVPGLLSACAHQRSATRPTARGAPSCSSRLLQCLQGCLMQCAHAWHPIAGLWG